MSVKTEVGTRSATCVVLLQWVRIFARISVAFARLSWQRACRRVASRDHYRSCWSPAATVVDAAVSSLSAPPGAAAMMLQLARNLAGLLTTILAAREASLGLRRPFWWRCTPRRQAISFIEMSIEAGILLGGKHKACFVLGVAGIELMPSWPNWPGHRFRQTSQNHVWLHVLALLSDTGRREWARNVTIDNNTGCLGAESLPERSWGCPAWIFKDIFLEIYGYVYMDGCFTVLALPKRQAICVGWRKKNARHLSWSNAQQPLFSLPNQQGRGTRTGRWRRSPRVSPTASQAGETDQTTKTDSAEHPESCQLEKWSNWMLNTCYGFLLLLHNLAFE